MTYKNSIVVINNKSKYIITLNKSLIMAVCKRNNCMAQIGHSPAERILRLCPVHYQGRQLNAARRTERAALICQYPACGISISETRNQFYCCKEHRDKARRLIDDDAIIRLVKHSYWINVESMLKNNSLGLGSITGPRCANSRSTQNSSAISPSSSFFHGCGKPPSAYRCRSPPGIGTTITV